MMSVIICALDMFFNFIMYFRGRQYEVIFRNVFTNVQYELGKEILTLSNKSLEENGSGMFIQRIIGDTRTISAIFTDINRYMNGILSNIGIIVSFFVINKPMFFFVIFSLIIKMTIETKRINTYNKSEKEFRTLNDSLTSFTGEIVKGAEDIKMLNSEDSFLLELKKRFTALNEKKFKMENTKYNYYIIGWNWYSISHLITMCIIAFSIKNNTLTLAMGVTVYHFSNRYSNLIFNITNFQELIKRFNLSTSRILEIYDNEKLPKETFGKKHIDKVKGNFSFQNVTFKYDKNKVLKNLSFKVKANETVAFVGKSGAGKTTIFKLLCKMYDDYKGSITIENTNIKELDKDSIRGNITIVSQNPYIFNMSIKDNLRLVKADITNKEIKEACKMACLDDFIEKLPDKYDTIIGEGGVNLSGGQKQRLAIARAFVQKTEIILFDEATSALDNETQTKIQQAIDNLQKDYTILIIAHRLSTIKNANRILVLDDGHIVAEGTHKQLMRNCKEYINLYNTEIRKKG